jgi:hypothetical protein
MLPVIEAQIATARFYGDHVLPQAATPRPPVQSLPNAQRCLAESATTTGVDA